MGKVGELRMKWRRHQTGWRGSEETWPSRKAGIEGRRREGEWVKINLWRLDPKSTRVETQAELDGGRGFAGDL
jgi:hypothetical protein